ncbi:MAG: hypothetical protein A2848_02360 [Candidatus Magasanikbacteria bacterium RIFCSPHIGHO2_01_FULL_50_8]|uniref:O-antigen ligase-related domain-containing protein n=2 Tax=Candidatus Magasanikiibacteriota TaxID=1752731 RepID=A0A1F6LRE8_9BACT|nr:MAG: hypothetical protein A2848_02360 [Candidatus Magasanikbacteria bacterium RIFCSPHIGHO2_01_FULL_50_8]OGH68110.1 MAG: hypothetical protein A3C15_01595 [Candidatus Magasanikbacteria bacterium RIFCSPHIGHO2_02_FULL_50_9b]
MQTALNRNFLLLLIGYIALRATSFFVRDVWWAETIIAALAIGCFAYFCIKDLSLGWKLLVIELLIDGAGHFFEFESLLLRTWFLGIFAAAWLWRKIRTRTPFVLPPRAVLIALVVFGLFFLWSILTGLMREHSPLFVLQDAMLYLFVLLLFPALEMQQVPQLLSAVATNVFIFGSTIFSVATFALYSSSVFTLTDPYYHWFRNVASGKITDLGLHFFRIVLPEHLLFVPIILVLFSCLLKKISDKKLWLLLSCSLLVVMLNFTRIYFVALAVGALFLLYHTPWKQWIKTASLTLAVSLLIFFSFHFVASRGASFGLDLIVGRAAGVRAPSSDVSGAIRMAMLPDIFRTITARPWLGSGLGTTVSYRDPTTQLIETRTQFDWGYFEMIAELGIFGTLAYLFLLIVILRKGTRSAVAVDSSVVHGLLAGAIALFIVNITTPALFQGFGVLYFVFLITMQKCKVVANE